MRPQERQARCQALAREVRRAVSELTHDDPALLTSIQEVARHLGVEDSYLLCEAFEILIAAGDVHVASGIVAVRGAGPLRSVVREQRRAMRLRGAGAERRARVRGLRERLSAVGR